MRVAAYKSKSPAELPTPLCVDEQEAADMLRIGLGTFQRLVRDGEIPRAKLRDATRFDVDELRAFVKRCKAMGAVAERGE